MEKNKSSIIVAVGNRTIKAEPTTDKDFPGIRVSVGDITAAVVEYDKENNKVLVRIYSKDNDDPAHVIDFEKIQIEDIAESIQLRAFMQPDIAIVGGDDVIEFGQHIKIDRVDIELMHIDNAIEYLQKLKEKL